MAVDQGMPQTIEPTVVRYEYLVSTQSGVALEAWLNDRAAIGFRLIATTQSGRGGFTSHTTVMERAIRVPITEKVPLTAEVVALA